MMREPMGAAVAELEKQLGTSWPTIAKACADAASKRTEFATALRDVGSSDSAIVFYGSLARGEWTSGSDADWTLLVDGPAQPTQLTTVRQIREKLEQLKVPPPTAGGAFGTIASSHDLVHRIGGDADTNRITTQRVLLLLESVPVEGSDGRQSLVHQRVIRSILRGYIEQGDGSGSQGVPRFLLNDVVRYWRTIAVDFAAKSREQGDRKWAVRRLKLRTSRKLIFSAGFVMSLEGCLAQTQQDREGLLETLAEATASSPLDTIARVALKHPSMKESARAVLNSYESFLELLDDEVKRKRLDSITREEAPSDPTFERARDIGREFGSAVEAFFFDGVFAKAIRTYGVF